MQNKPSIKDASFEREKTISLYKYISFRMQNKG